MTTLRVSRLVFLFFALLSQAPFAQPITLHVSPAGNDAWSGGLENPSADGTDGPLRSLIGARDRLRTLRANAPDWEGARISIHGGEYEPAAPLTLGPEDSGTETGPVDWQAAFDEAPVILGGRRVTNWALVTDAALLERLPEAARGKVVAADLGEMGIADFGTAEGNGLMLYSGGRPMTLARWPNEGFVRISEVTGGDPVTVHGRTGDTIGKWTYEDDRPARWAGEPDVWVHGYWFWDWSDQRQKAKRIDAAEKTIEIEPPYHGYGYRNGQWYYYYNVFGEIDMPGEWYLDRSAGTLYFWPPDGDPSDTFVSVLSELVSATDASFVRFTGLTLEGARTRAMALDDCFYVQVNNCTVRNMGGDAVSVNGGRGVRVRSSTFYNLGGGAIALSGGDRVALKRGDHAAVDNHIHDYGQWYRMYRTAISLNGMGHTASGNYIHDAPHMAIGFSGNDHAIENNEIHDVCLESNDAGAIYAGRDWTMRGTVIRNNFLHNITGFRNEGCVGVYLDDMFCGTVIENNLFFRVTRAAFIGGGRDNAVRGNVFVDCDPALHIDDRAMNWAAYHVDEIMTERLKAMPFEGAPWSEKYPELLTVLQDEPAVPKGNVVEHNLSVGGTWDEISKPIAPMVHMNDNVILGDDALSAFTIVAPESRPRATEFAAGLDSVTLPERRLAIDLRAMDRRKE